MLQGGKLPVELLTTLISRLSIAGIAIDFKLPGPVVKIRPLKSQQVIPGNKTCDPHPPPGSKSVPLSDEYIDLYKI